MQVATVFPPLPESEGKPVTVLGIDQSTNCGWAILNAGMRKPLWGVLKLATGDDETSALMALHDHIAQAVAEHGVTDVFFEQPIIPQHQPTMGSMRAFMYVAAIQLAAKKHTGRSAQQVPISTWRKRFTGHGRAPKHDFENRRKLDTHPARRKWWKQQAIKACLERGWMVDNDNAAEAIAIAEFGLCCLVPSCRVRTDPLFRRAEMAAERTP